MTPKDKLASIQTILGVAADGKFGAKSKAALEALIHPPAILTPETPQTPAGVAVANAIDPRSDAVDPGSEAAIKTLHPKLQPIARQFVAMAKPTIKITSGTRTYAEQNALYEQGRSKPGAIVTGARGGHSSHNFGTAFDVTIFDEKGPVWESSDYRNVLAPLGERLGLSWGGRWTKPDEPHFYLIPEWATDMSESDMMAGLRRRHDLDIDAFA